jgi:hypothetical protein
MNLISKNIIVFDQSKQKRTYRFEISANLGKDSLQISIHIYLKSRCRIAKDLNEESRKNRYKISGFSNRILQEHMSRFCEDLDVRNVMNRAPRSSRDLLRINSCETRFIIPVKILKWIQK